MRFMQDDEFLLLMSHCEDRGVDDWRKQHILTISERIRLREVGIKTSHEQPAWLRVEPSRGNYDFGYIDKIINCNREAGLKSLIQLCGWRLPKWMPNEWRARQKDGVYEDETLSFWNEEAQEYSDNYYRTVINHYAGQEDVTFFFGEFQGGEGAYPSTWPLYDQAALDDYKRVFGTSAHPIPDTPDTLRWFGSKVGQHMQRKQAILYPLRKEIWNAQQYLMDTWTKSFGNFVQADVMELHRMTWPDANIVLLQYTYFDSSHTIHNERHVDNLVWMTKCDVIAEAMFCLGLPTTTPKAIAKGFRGQIICPAHKEEEKSLEGWMVDNIRKSHDLWKQVHELAGG